MDVARTLYQKQNGIEESDNNALPKEDTDKLTAKAEIPQEKTAEGKDERIIVSKTANEPDDMNNEDNDYDKYKPDDMNNEVIDYDSYSMRLTTEIYIEPDTTYPIVEDLTVKTTIDSNEDTCNTDEAVLDPDNFEYFKGVSSNNFETNFLNR